MCQTRFVRRSYKLGQVVGSHPLFIHLTSTYCSDISLFNQIRCIYINFISYIFIFLSMYIFFYLFIFLSIYFLSLYFLSIHLSILSKFHLIHILFIIIFLSIYLSFYLCINFYLFTYILMNFVI
jgi:hypothetical protein